MNKAVEANTVDLIEGRKFAESILELAGEELALKSQSFQFAFWREIKNAVARSGAIPVQNQKTELGVMTYDEARSFESKPIPFGIFKGQKYAEVSVSYLLMLADGAVPIQAYLRSEIGKKRIEDGT